MVRPVLYTIQSLKDHAAGFGGLCLKDDYKGFRRASRWQCKNGHVWTANWESVKRSETFCAECNGHVRAAPDIPTLKKLFNEECGESKPSTHLNAVLRLFHQIALTQNIEDSATIAGFDYDMIEL